MSFRWISRISLCCFAATAQANAATLFYFRSDPGDYIGGRRQVPISSALAITHSTVRLGGISILPIAAGSR